MRRIDKMTKEEICDFFENKFRECDTCPVGKENCKNVQCVVALRNYLMGNVRTKKRFLTYNSMSDSKKDFENYCENTKCNRCKFISECESQYDSETGVFFRWLDEEIEVESDDK